MKHCLEGVYLSATCSAECGDIWSRNCQLAIEVVKSIFIVCLFIPQGANSYGQLGSGHKEDTLLPSRCLLPAGVDIGKLRQVTGGGGHSALLTGTRESSYLVVSYQNQVPSTRMSIMRLKVRLCLL